MNFKEFIVKLQGLTDSQKRIILWTTVAIFGVIMGYFWIVSTVNDLQKMTKSVSQIKIPSVQMPSSDILQTTTPSNENPVAEKNISEQDAVNLVKNLPEVKNWLALFNGPNGTSPTTGGKPIVELVIDPITGEDSQNGIYVVHVYERTPDHTATLNWYDVDKKTGNIKSEF